MGKSSQDEEGSAVKDLLSLPHAAAKDTNTSSREDGEASDVDISHNLDPLTPKSLWALNRLARYRPPMDKWPPVRRAAVLVGLFGGRNGDLYVILSTRASTLKSHPGEVCLPGGKAEPSDIDLEYTARREAFEEIGLEMNITKCRLVTSLRPFLTRSFLLVTPIVCFVLDTSSKPVLNPSEVSDVFSHPLESFLQHKPQEPVYHSLSSKVQSGQIPYHSSYEVENFLEFGKPFRYHRFSGTKDHPGIYGFTADILIEVATLAYGHPPEFQKSHPQQWSRHQLIKKAITTSEIFKSALKETKANLKSTSDLSNSDSDLDSVSDDFSSFSSRSKTSQKGDNDGEKTITIQHSRNETEKNKLESISGKNKRRLFKL